MINQNTYQRDEYFNLRNIRSDAVCCTCKIELYKFVKIMAGDQIYCVICFTKLQKFPQNYSVINKLNFPVYDKDWTAQEELLMFEGLQRKGFGNWEQIAVLMGSGKSKQKIQQHYLSIYLNQVFKQAPLISRRDPQTLQLFGTTSKKIIRQKEQIIQQKEVTQGYRQFSQFQPAKRHTSNMGQIIGYWPLRKDFQIEYDNDAELLIAELQITQEDTQQQTKMIQKMLELYYKRLTQRYAKKQFVLERDLLELNSYKAQPRTKQEKEIYNLLKVFARFNTPEKHQKLVQGLIKQKQLSKKIAQLKYYHSLGFKTFQEIQKRILQKKNIQINKLKRKTQQKSRTRIHLDKSQKKPFIIDTKQKQLCNSLGINENEYIKIHDMMIRDYIKNGYLQYDQEAYDISCQKGAKIYNFLLERKKINISQLK